MDSFMKDDIVELVRGSNRVLKNREEWEENAIKRYDAECGSGFYLSKDIEIAMRYAKETSEYYGGEPIITYYSLNLLGVKNKLKTAYYNELNKDSMEYVGLNILGRLPENCRYEIGTPKELCHNCREERCNWNSDYIEAILSQADYNLDNELIRFVTGKISEDKVIDEINYELSKRNLTKIRLQIMLRNEAFNYLDYVNHVRASDLDGYEKL